MSTYSLDGDTIAAIATPFGQGGIGIVRVSGPEAVSISQQLMRGAFPDPRVATCRSFLDVEGNTLDQGILIYFPKPNSFTGEEVVEFQGHGSPFALQALLNSLLSKGARLARPGEFSERAFLNGQLNLTQAEAIADLIAAGSEKAARAAVRSLQGAFSEKVQKISESLIQLRAAVEASIDFSEEEIAVPTQRYLESQMQKLIQDLQALVLEAQQGQRLQEGMQLAIMGAPNSGKSTLLNALSGQDLAITSKIPGTTRDVLSSNIELDGLVLHLLDTAGLHETEDALEKEGIRRALGVMEKADLVLWITDSHTEESVHTPHQMLKALHQSPTATPFVVIRNKIDLSQEERGIIYDKAYDIIRVSALTQAGLPELKDYLKKKAGYAGENVGFSARLRHLHALKEAEHTLTEGLVEWRHATLPELLAFSLTQSHRLLGEITGVFTTEDLLGRIFSTFCIGK